MKQEMEIKLRSWFGDDIFDRKPKKKKRRTQEEILEDSRVTCRKCGHSWYHCQN